MPQLKSGRHVAVAADALTECFKGRADANVYALIAAYRLAVQEPAHLRALLPVVYFQGGGPPEAPPYMSGHLVQDVLSGKADWALEEIEEFKSWLEANQPLNAWLSENFDSINAAIRDSPLWQSELAGK